MTFAQKIDQAWERPRRAAPTNNFSSRFLGVALRGHPFVDSFCKAITVVIIALAMVSTGCQPDRSPSTSPANSPSPSAQQLALIDDLRKLTESHCGIKAEAIDVDAPLQKQGCDDLDFVELVMAIEEKYNMTISDADADGASVNSLARVINKR